ncbi:alanyl-tRNA editing protein [Deinococcus sp. YIM 134068]|uniref:alanyl-tRNA editing protein n=1 Tax=Deinococcus lichenicola TaxID=3118910 RepID=UPI002F95B2BE
MTRALYRDHPGPLTFTATVTAVREEAVALDATAFYPEGGGQNGDGGVLRWDGGEARVRDTRKGEGGRVWHELEGPGPEVGAVITGEVDAARRWRNSQRHGGEHLLAQAFHRVNPAFRVAAVSMRNPESTLDLEGDPTEADVRAAESLLRETLGRVPLTLDTPTVPDTELHRYPLRREAKVSGNVRLVIFRDESGVPFDVSACGGTHVPQAAMAAPVVVLRTERIRGGLTRVFFMAGEEATEYLSGVHVQARTLARGFSAPVETLPERVAALTAERDAARTEAVALRQRLAHLLVRQAPTRVVSGVTLREVMLEDATLLPSALTDVPPGEVVVVLSSDGRCGIGSGREDVNAGSLLGQALKVTGGRGGGRPTLAQGTTARPEAFFEAVRRILSERRTDG